VRFLPPSICVTLARTRRWRWYSEAHKPGTKFYPSMFVMRTVKPTTSISGALAYNAFQIKMRELWQVLQSSTIRSEGGNREPPPPCPASTGSFLDSSELGSHQAEWLFARLSDGKKFMAPTGVHNAQTQVHQMFYQICNKKCINARPKTYNTCKYFSIQCVRTKYQAMKAYWGSRNIDPTYS